MAMTKGARTRARILQAAAEQFAVAGYHGTTYSDLIAGSGLSKGAHYFHFGSKQELALEVYRTRQAEVADTSPLERLFHMLEVRAQLFVADRSLLCLPRLSTDFSRDPALAEHVAEMHGNAIRFIAGLLQEAERAGELNPAVDADAAARALFAALVGLGEVSERESQGRDLLERSREFWNLLRPALSAPHHHASEKEE
jgi:AcrR family transcriptional regulator